MNYEHETLDNLTGTLEAAKARLEQHSREEGKGFLSTSREEWRRYELTLVDAAASTQRLVNHLRKHHRFGQLRPLHRLSSTRRLQLVRKLVDDLEQSGATGREPAGDTSSDDEELWYSSSSSEEEDEVFEIRRPGMATRSSK